MFCVNVMLYDISKRTNMLQLEPVKSLCFFLQVHLKYFLLYAKPAEIGVCTGPHCVQIH